MTKNEKIGACEFVGGVRMVRNLQGQKKDDLVGAEERSFALSNTEHWTLKTDNQKKKSGPL
ncbi:hypothetical protein HY988_03385 [Candidatus Micrarchaeota archaeon]|nr:hypothetical protein [Candidatus Micrarchaeota archaeon]